MQVQMPEYTSTSQQRPEDSLLYTFTVDSDWVFIESGHGTVVYAYASGGDEMSALQPGDSTTALTTQMTMRSISNAEYAAIDDINFKIISYAIGTEGVSTNPLDAWNECKAIGNIS